MPAATDRPRGPMEPIAYVRDAEGTVDEVQRRLEAALGERGFGVLAVVRVHEILRAKLGAEIDPVVLLDVCSPRHARDALAATREVATLLPCKIAVSVEGGRTRLALQRPTIVLGALLPHPDLARLGAEVEEALRAAVDRAAAPG